MEKDTGGNQSTEEDEEDQNSLLLNNSSLTPEPGKPLIDHRTLHAPYTRKVSELSHLNKKEEKQSQSKIQNEKKKLKSNNSNLLNPEKNKNVRVEYVDQPFDSIQDNNILSSSKNGVFRNLSSLSNDYDEMKDVNTKKPCKNVKFSLLGRICAGTKPITGQTDIRPLIGVDIIDIKPPVIDVPVDGYKTQTDRELSSSEVSYDMEKKRFSCSSGENQDLDSNSDVDTFTQTINTADKFESVNVWDEEYTSLKNNLLRNDPLVYQGNEMEESFTQAFDKLEKNSRKRKGKKPIFVQNKMEDNSVSTSEEEYHDEYLVKSSESIYSSVEHLYDESDTSSQMTPDHSKKSPQKLHPFAITSPSFNKAAAPAVMTTSIGHSGTVVTISIVTKKSNDSVDHLTSTEMMSGGITSLTFKKGESSYEDIVSENGVELEEDKNDTEPKKMYSQVMEKLKTIDSENNNELHKHLDRMEVNVQILDRQLIQNGEQKRWQCQLCPKSYTTKHNLVTHILDHNGIKPHLCMVCGKYFKQLSHLNTHMLTHDNIKPHICTICGKEFTQISHLKRHETLHLENRPYICDICDRGFAYPSELRTHKEKHNSDKEKCETCGEEFDTVKALKLHAVLHENKEELICKYCGKVFRYPSQLKDHMITHEGSRPYICTECGMDFMKEHHLKAHQFTHTGQKPYSCDICGRSFNQKANMMRHVLIHNATRAFKCEICGKTFTQPQTLKAHQVVHSKNKPFQCKFCGKQFGRLHNLQGHLHMHNDTKPYSCFCGSTFTLKGNLNRHKKVKHGLDESTEDMEEEAVNFLNEMSSGRTQNDIDGNFLNEISSGRTHSEMDDSNSVDQVLSSPDSKSPRKGRKSVPRKLLQGQGVIGSSLLEESDDNTLTNDEHQLYKTFYNSFVEESERFTQESVGMETGIGIDIETSPVSKSVRKRKKPERVFNLDEFDDEQFGEFSDIETEDLENESKKNKVNAKGTKLDSLLKEKFNK